MHDREELASRHAGMEAYRRGDFATAVSALSRRVAVAPHDAEAICKLGNAQSACGMHPQAVATLAALVARLPGRAEVRYYYGMVLSRAGRPVEAAAELRRTLELQPGHAGATAWIASLSGPGPQSISPAAVETRKSQGTAAYFFTVGCAAYRVLFFWLLAGGVFLVVWGHQRQAEGRRYPAPVDVAYDQFVAQMPRQGWFRLHDCILDLTNATWSERRDSSHSVSEIYIPVRGIASSADPSIHLLYASEEADLNATVERLADFQRRGDTRGMEELVKQHPETILVRRDICGVIQTGLRGSDDRNAGSRQLLEHLDPNFVVLDDDQPNPGYGTFLVVIGICLLAITAGPVALGFLLGGVNLLRRLFRGGVE